MADAYTSTKITGNKVTGGQLTALEAGYAQPFEAVAKYTFAGAQANADVLRFFKNLPPDLIITEIDIACAALTGMTGVTLGIWKPDLGAALSAAFFMTGQTLASAVASLNPKTAIDGMANVSLTNYGKRLFEQAGHTVEAGTKLEAYDLAMQLTTAGSASGLVVIRIAGVQG